MNKNLYRIVFNKARGMLMVVAEIVRAAQGSPSSGLGHTLSQCIGKLTAVSLGLLLALGAVQPVQATIIADGSAAKTQQPTIVTTSNGTPQINIQTPSAAGVSRNVYSQFDIDQKGAILNNSHKQIQTPTGGWVDANPWLAKGEAKIILNEVNSRNPSQLNGIIEVAGQKAQVVIANPSGITCSGCGFINANRTTLTTGQVLLNNGALTGYNVERGNVVVNGAGMDSSRQEYTDIIARSTEINAGIWANELNVTVGRNKVDASHQKIEKQSEDSGTRPQLAVDVAHLGGMYANKIRLIGTENGVGVRNAGNIGALAGSVTVTANGRIENSGTVSAQENIDLKSQGDVDNSGTLLAHTEASVNSRGSVINSGTLGAQTRNITVTSGGDIENSGTLFAQGDASINSGKNLSNSGTLFAPGNAMVASKGALQNSGTLLSRNDASLTSGGSLQNSGSLAATHNLHIQAASLYGEKGSQFIAGVLDDGTLGGNGDLRITTSGSLLAHGQNLATDELSMRGEGIDLSESQTQARSIALAAGEGSLLTRNAQIIAQQQLTASTGTTLDNDGGVLSADSLSLTAYNLSNQDGDILQSGYGDLLLNHAGEINNHGGRIASNSENLTLRSAKINNQQGQIIHAGNGSFSLQTEQLLDDSGQLLSNGLLALSGGDLALDDAITSAQQITLEADSLSNRNGQVIQNGSSDMTLTVRQGIDNQNGLLAANGTLRVNAAMLNNQNGSTIAAQDGNLELLISGELDNRSGELAGSQGLTLQADSLDNRLGWISAINNDATLLTHKALNNSGGLIEANHALNLTSAGLNNQSGQLVGGALSLALGTAALDNQQGVIAATEKLTLNSGAINNDNGLLQSSTDITINTHGQSLSNRDSGDTGGIFSDGALSINSGALDNSQGMLVGGDTRLQTGTLDNLGGQLIARQGLTLDSLALDNQQGLIACTGDLTLTSDALNNYQGALLSYQDLTATTLMLNNQGGVLQSLGQITLDTQGNPLDNRNGGFIGSGRSLHLASGDILNNAGALYSADSATLNFTLLDNHGGQLAAQQALALTGSVINNDDGGLIQSGAALTLTSDSLSNHNSGDMGGITSQGAMAIHTGKFDNSAGALIAGTSLQLNSAALNNQSGILVAQQALNAHTDSLNNNSGLIQSGGDLQWDTRQSAIDNRNGTLYSLGELQLNGGALNNQAGTLGAKGNMTLNVADIENGAAGRIISEQDMALHTAAVNNQQGQIQAVGILLLDSAQDIIDNASGLIRSGASLTLDALKLINNTTRDANLGVEGQSVTLNTGSLDNQHGSILADKQLSITSAATLDNSNGLLSAGDTLRLQGAALNLLNNTGVAQAGSLLEIYADTLNGDGQLLSLDALNITSTHSFTNNGEVIANGNLTFTSSGDVINNGKFLAGEKLDLHASNLTNNLAGEFNAGQDWLTVTQTLTNYGLIDGIHTRLETTTLNNTGTGRIYGDAVSVQAVTFNNLAQNGKAAVLAGREQVEIGVQTLNNRDHALIYSGGNMSIGGTLDATHQATGRAGAINNRSATIEAADNMWLSAGLVNNINEHFSTEVVTLSVEEMKEYQLKGDDTRWQEDEIYITNSEVNFLHTPEYTDDDYTEFDFTRTEQETQIATSDPAQIIAGGNISINADRLLNDKSQIIAGGTLAIAAKTVENTEVAGEHLTTDIGTATHYFRKTHKGRDEQKHDATAYTPPTVIQTITLKPGALVSHGQVTGNTIDITRGTAPQTLVAPDASGSVNAGVAGSGVTADFTASGSDINAVFPSGELSSGQLFEVTAKVDAQNGTAAQSVVRMAGVNIRLPDNSLFITHAEANSHYLVETDPRFTQQKPFMGTDYMLNALLPKVQQPEDMFKRLGDGFYEQRLVREQVVALSGQRYLDGYSNDEEQLKGLMDAGITFGQQYNLRVGVALTAEQMSLLTSDIVWLVAQTVTLPDGTSQQVLVPQVYARVQPGDVDGSGALLAGKNVSLKLDSDLLNSGTIAGREIVQLSADNLTNQGGRIQGADVSLQARTDINNVGGSIIAQDSLFASAGRDINISSATRTAQSTNGRNSFERTTLDRVAGLYVQGTDGQLVLQAGRDLNVTAAQIVNSGDNGTTQLIAGRDIQLGTVTTGSRDNLVWDKNNSLNQGNRQEVGSEIIGSGAVTLSAGNNINARAATISAGEALGLFAGNDISIVNGESQHDLDERHKTTGSGFLSKTTTTTRDQFDITTAQASSLSGNSIAMMAGNNLLVQGSSVVGEQGVALLAGNDLTLTGATERSAESHMSQEKKSGFSGTGGIGVSYGSQSLKLTDDAQTLTNYGSTVGSVSGDVTLVAGNNLAVTGSDLVAGQDMALSGKNVSIMAAQEQSSQTHKMEQQTSGLTLALSGSVGSAVSGAVETVQQAKEADSGRLAALEGVKAVLSGAEAVQAGRLADAQGDDKGNSNTIGISLSYGSQSASSTQHSEQSVSQGSSLMAGDNLSIIAAGDGAGDITVQGSQIQAGKDMLLDAERDITLISGLNTQLTTGENKSSGGTFGVGIGLGEGGWGISISASGNTSQGNESGNGTTHSETTLDAGGGVTLISGRDTTLTGAQVSGDNIKAEVGRNLTLISEQDSDRYDSEQRSASAGGSISFGGGSASMSLSQDGMHSNYDSVTDQTGMFAGQGGFDITVGNHTQLDGAAIASTAGADKNRLDTGTLGFSDIQNRADFETAHQGIGVSSGGGSIGGQFAGNMANSLLAGGGNEGHADSTTHAAISDGTIVIRDQDNQTQNVDGLSRDAEHANQSLSPIFDKEKEQQRLQEVQLIAEIGSQAMDIARTEGDINGLNEAKKAHPELGADELRNTPEYKAAMDKYGTGSDIQRGLQAATAAVQGLAGGDLAQAIAGGASPYLAEVIKKVAPDEESRVIAHIVLGAVSAELQGGNALAGASGAGISAAGAEYIKTQLYGDRSVDQLTEQEKQTVVMLATLAGGLAGGIVGGDSSSTMDGGKAAQNEANFNWADSPSTDQQVRVLSEQYGKALSDCQAGDSNGCRQKDELEKSYIFLAVTAGTSMMGGAASTTAKVISTGLSGAANATSQLLSDDPFSYQNFLIAGVSGWKSAGASLVPTVGISGGTAYISSTLDGKDAMGSVIGATAGSIFGYGVGAGITNQLTKREIEKKIGMSVSQNALKYMDEPIHSGSFINSDIKLSPYPGIWGGFIGGIGSEEGGSFISDQFKPKDQKK